MKPRSRVMALAAILTLLPVPPAGSGPGVDLETSLFVTQVWGFHPGAPGGGYIAEECPPDRLGIADPVVSNTSATSTYVCNGINVQSGPFEVNARAVARPGVPPLAQARVGVLSAGGYASSVVRYQVGLRKNSPSVPDVPVPVRVRAAVRAEVQGTGEGRALAGVNLSASGVNEWLIAEACMGFAQCNLANLPDPTPRQDGSWNRQVPMLPGQNLSVDLVAEVGDANAQVGNTFLVRATSDPTFELEPADQDDYHLVFSPNIHGDIFGDGFESAGTGQP